jgi:type VI secretion system secreted protein VgrG
MVIEVTNNDYNLSAKRIHALADDKIDSAVASCKIVTDPTGITLSAFGSSIKLDASGVTVIGPLIKLNN